MRSQPDALGSRLVIGGHTVASLGHRSVGQWAIDRITMPLSIRGGRADFVTSIDSGQTSGGTSQGRRHGFG
jgi:hypothetical protein